MKNRIFITEAIVLKRFNYGEADKVVTLFSKDRGKFSVIAKGIRKQKSRKRGHLELFTHIKAQVVNGRSMGILTEVEALNYFLGGNLSSSQLPHDRSQLELFVGAYQYAELIDRLVPENEAYEDIFELLLKSLQAISSYQLSLDQLDGYFKNKLIRILGFWPHEQTTPKDINAYVDSLLEKPLNSYKIRASLRTLGP